MEPPNCCTAATVRRPENMAMSGSGPKGAPMALVRSLPAVRQGQAGNLLIFNYFNGMNSNLFINFTADRYGRCFYFFT